MGYLAINTDYYRTPEFIEFNKTSRAGLFFFILAGVIRASMVVQNPNHGGHHIYKTYFLNGDLVCRYPQDRMAEYMQYKSQGTISKLSSALVKDGFIEKIYESRPGVGRICFYKVGVWEGTLGDENSYKETLFYDTIFTAYTDVAKKKRSEEKRHYVPTPEDANTEDLIDILPKEGPFTNG